MLHSFWYSTLPGFIYWGGEGGEASLPKIIPKCLIEIHMSINTFTLLKVQLFPTCQCCSMSMASSSSCYSEIAVILAWYLGCWSIYIYPTTSTSHQLRVWCFKNLHALHTHYFPNYHHYMPLNGRHTFQHQCMLPVTTAALQHIYF